MVDLYVTKGLNIQDAQKVVSIISKNKKFFVDVMMKEELNLLPPDEKLNILVSGKLVQL